MPVKEGPVATKQRQDHAADEIVGTLVDPSRHTLLIVEDDADLLKILKASFDRTGYRVVTASRAKDGFAILAGGGIDLILADFQMPEMNGLDMLERIKQESPAL